MTIAQARERMDKSLDSVRREFTSVRSGKATPTLLDTVRVDAYGSKMSLNQVGTVSAPEPRMLHKLAEEGRVAVRQIRQDANKEIKAKQGKHEVSEDDAHRQMEEIQKLTDQHIKKIDELLGHKEQEVMEV